VLNCTPVLPHAPFLQEGEHMPLEDSNAPSDKVAKASDRSTFNPNLNSISLLGGNDSKAADVRTANTATEYLPALQLTMPDSNAQTAQATALDAQAVNPSSTTPTNFLSSFELQLGNFEKSIATDEQKLTTDLKSLSSYVDQVVGSPSNDAGATTYNPANDAPLQNLSNTGDSQLQSTLLSAWSDVAGGQLTQNGYNTFENAAIPLTNSYGQFQNDTQLEQAALTAIQPNVSASDYATLQSLVNPQTTSSTGDGTSSPASGSSGATSPAGSDTGGTSTTTPSTGSDGSNNSGGTVTNPGTGTTGNPFTLTSDSTGAFSVDGTEILDPNGNTVQLKGTNVWPQEGSVATAQQLAANGINFARVNLQEGAANDPSISDLQTMVQNYNAAGIITEFEVRGPGGGSGDVATGSDLSTLQSQYANLAQTFAGNPGVWFGTPNEAGDNTTAGSASEMQSWQNEISTIDSAVRDNGYKNPILVDDSNWGQGITASPSQSSWGPSPSSAILTDASQLTSMDPNMIVAPHVYNSDSNASQEVSAAVQTYESTLNKPVVLEEVGGGTTDDQGGQASIQLAQSKSVAGAVAWEWNGQDNFTQLDANGNLNAWGQEWVKGITNGSL
jgi:hypothetical protein